MLSTPAAQDLPVALAPRVWRDTRWVGSIAGHATTPDLLAGATSSADQKRSITRIYAGRVCRSRAVHARRSVAAIGRMGALVRRAAFCGA